MREQEGSRLAPAVSTLTAPSSKPALSLLQGLDLHSNRRESCMMLILLQQTAKLTSATIFWYWGSAWPAVDM